TALCRDRQPGGLRESSSPWLAAYCTLEDAMAQLSRAPIVAAALGLALAGASAAQSPEGPPPVFATVKGIDPAQGVLTLTLGGMGPAPDGWRPLRREARVLLPGDAWVLRADGGRLADEEARQRLRRGTVVLPRHRPG